MRMGPQYVDHFFSPAITKHHAVISRNHLQTTRSNPNGCSTGGGSNAHHGLFQLQTYDPSPAAQFYMTYHTRRVAADRGKADASYQRNVGVDRAYTSKTTAAFQPVSATPAWIRQLKYVDPYPRSPSGTVNDPIPGATMSSASDGVTTVPIYNGAGIVAGGYDRAVQFPAFGSSWTKVTGVDFGTKVIQAPQQFSAMVYLYSLNGQQPDKKNADAAVGLTLRIDAVDGRVAAACPITAASGAADGWVTLTCPVVGPAVMGVHDLYFVADTTLGGINAFSAGGETVGILLVLQLAYWQLSGGIGSGSIPPSVVVPCTSLQNKVDAQILVAPTATNGIIATAAAIPGPQSAFYLVDNEDGSYAIMLPSLTIGTGSGATYAYVCAFEALSTLDASATSPSQPCARFQLQGTTDGSYALYSLLTQKYVRYFHDSPTGGYFEASAMDPRQPSDDSARFWLECGEVLRY